MPSSFYTPYYRSRLSLKPNKTTGISQHETLLRLKDIQNSAVFYVCGMVFSQEDIWKPADIDDLRFVDIKTAPKGWATNASHFLCFQDSTDQIPMWCSEPTPGLAYSMSDLFENELLPRRLEAEEAITLIHNAVEAIAKFSENQIAGYRRAEGNCASWLPDCFALIEFEQTNV